MVLPKCQTVYVYQESHYMHHKWLCYEYVSHFSRNSFSLLIYPHHHRIFKFSKLSYSYLQSNRTLLLLEQKVHFLIMLHRYSYACIEVFIVQLDPLASRCYCESIRLFMALLNGKWLTFQKCNEIGQVLFDSDSVGLEPFCSSWLLLYLIDEI